MSETATVDEMSRDQIDDFLRTEGDGVLSLQTDTVPYAFPVSFGYNGEVIYLQFVRNTKSENEKTDYLTNGTNASLTAYTKKPITRSVIVTGSVAPIQDDELPAASMTIAENASQFADAPRVDDTDRAEYTFYKFTIASVNGRVFPTRPETLTNRLIDST